MSVLVLNTSALITGLAPTASGQRAAGSGAGGGGRTRRRRRRRARPRPAPPRGPSGRLDAASARAPAGAEVSPSASDLHNMLPIPDPPVLGCTQGNCAASYPRSPQLLPGCTATLQPSLGTSQHSWMMHSAEVYSQQH